MEDIDLDQIRSLIRYLAKPGDTPDLTDGVPKPSFLDVSEISFEDNSWLTHAVDLQLWLNLNAPLNSDATPQQVATALFEDFSLAAGSAAFSVGPNGVIRLTELGAQHLEDRLAQAARLRDGYEAAIEDGRSRGEATEEWREAWQEWRELSDEPAPKQPRNIDAKVGTWKIFEFADRAGDGELNLNPHYQRDVVWSNSSSQKLIDSILRGIPLPSIILATVAADQRYQIVDGKQRLTAILRFMGKHPEGVMFAQTAKSPELFRTDMGAFVRKNSLTANDLRKHYLPFKTLKYKSDHPLFSLSGKYYSEIKDIKVRIAGADIAIKRIFESTSDYMIPVLEYRNTPVRDIHWVFRIYNQQGVKLNSEEIRNAVFNHLDITKLMLFISGDRPDVALVPFMEDPTNRFDSVREIIESRGFGVVRFKRTKVLLWVLSTVLFPTHGKKNDGYRTPSTATHIDAFLRYIDDSNTPLKGSSISLRQLAKDMAEAVELHHKADDAWHPGFRSKGKATKWEELPMVASLCACFVLVVVGKADLLCNAAVQIRDLTRKKPGPRSTQNRTQWAHISDVTISILCALGIDLDLADNDLVARYQSSAIKGLIALQELQDFNPKH